MRSFSTIYSTAIGVAVLSQSVQGSPRLQSRDAGGPNLAVLGDSYASGLMFTPFNGYDGNKDKCLRWNKAYAKLLEDDKGPLPHATMQFIACSGAILGDIWLGQKQITKVKTDNLDAIIMHIGGNNLGFADVARSCLFLGDSSKPDYPSKDSECYKALDNASNKVKPGGEFRQFLRDTYTDMLEKSDAGKKTKAKFYHNGYIQFFNEAAGDKDWCTKDRACFALFCKRKELSKYFETHLLTLDRRRAINQVVKDINSAIQSVIGEAKFKDRFAYIDVDAEFKDHRFCEPGSSLDKQYNDYNNVWLFNLNSPPVWLDDMSKTDQKASPRLTKPFIYEETDPKAEAVVKKAVGAQSGSTGITNDWWWGWELRTMHPNERGHLAVEDAILKKLDKDNIRGYNHQ